MLRRTEMSNINSAALESIEQGIDQLARSYPYADADYLHERTRNGLHYVTKQLEGRMTLRQHRELLVDAGWLFLLNACVQYDRGQREAANLSKAAALRIGDEAGHGEIKAWAWEIEAWFALTQSRWQDMLDAVEAGHMADQTHSVGVQLYAHKARAAARMGNGRLVRESLDAGRARWTAYRARTTPNTTSSSTRTSGTSTRWTPTVSSETTSPPPPTPAQ